MGDECLFSLAITLLGQLWATLFLPQWEVKVFPGQDGEERQSLLTLECVWTQNISSESQGQIRSTVSFGVTRAKEFRDSNREQSSQSRDSVGRKKKQLDVWLTILANEECWDLGLGGRLLSSPSACDWDRPALFIVHRWDRAIQCILFSTFLLGLVNMRHYHADFYPGTFLRTLYMPVTTSSHRPLREMFSSLYRRNQLHAVGDTARIAWDVDVS